MARSGDQIEGWVLVSQIGKGGQGAVWEAQDVENEAADTVAIKLISVGKTKKRERFLTELKAHVQLSDDQAANIIPVLSHNLDLIESGAERGFIVMPRAMGSLEEFSERLIGRFELCLEVFRGVVRGLSAAHDADIIHRDLKPANILFLDEAMRSPVVADFGICFLKATPDKDRVTQEGETVGARYFMAPEQERGGVAEIQPSADVYALGKLLHHMYTGRLLYREELDLAFRKEELAGEPRLKWLLEEVLPKCVVEDPGQRYADAGELLAALESPGMSGSDPSEDDRAEEVAEPDSQGSHDTVSLETLPQDYRRAVDMIVDGRFQSLELEFDEHKQQFRGAWRLLAHQIEHPDQAPEGARELIQSQAPSLGLGLALARTDSGQLYPAWKRWIEFTLAQSDEQSGYPAIFSIPHLVGGFLYMAASVQALTHRSWEVLRMLFEEPFEWRYRSDDLHFTRGPVLSYFFHPETLGRYSNKAHDFYRELLGTSEVQQVTGLEGDDLLNAYLQVQFLMTISVARDYEAGTASPIWPDYGRFHAFRLTPLLRRIELDQSYGVGIATVLGVTYPTLLEKLPDWISIPPTEFWGPSRFIWNSVSKWEPSEPSA